MKQEEPELEVALSAQVLSFKQPKLIDESDVSIPAKYPDYVPFGFYKDLTNIINTGTLLKSIVVTVRLTV